MSTGLLRFITCGSVDDGKSSLIGRLLYDTGNITDDHLRALEKEKKTINGHIDLSILLDGLQTEREQGVTIDVAYRYFCTDKRHFIIADTPGHDQYTRNMATAASNAELAIVLVDARLGLQPQTFRHAYILALFGIKHVVLAVNKMDLALYKQDSFDKIHEKFSTALEKIYSFESIQAIPLSALTGENIVELSKNMPWYQGPTLIQYLNTVDVKKHVLNQPLRMMIQGVLRGEESIRAYSGRISSGSLKIDDDVIIHPSDRRAKIRRLLTMNGDLSEASAGQSIAFVLDRHLDVARGDVITSTENPALTSDSLIASIVWMSDTPLEINRRFLFQLGTQLTGCVVIKLLQKIDLETLEMKSAEQLILNDIGMIEIKLDRSITSDPYNICHDMGGFILIDRFSSHTIAAGVIVEAKPSQRSIYWQHFDLNKNTRSQLKNQKPCVIWFTGLSASGKSTIANILEKKLYAMNIHTYLLDGDNIRHGLSRDLDFSAEDRTENIRRVAEVVKLFVDAGIVVIVCMLSPFINERRMARLCVEPDEFIEVHMDTPLSVCESRDPKGLYRKARAGELKNFTGIDSPYENPLKPELKLDASELPAETLADLVIDLLRDRGILTTQVN